MKGIFLPLVAMLLACALHGQNFSYTRYDIGNGLAGSTVYNMLRDKQGFMWFATETGVSRFDGTNFKNFTTADGLPDNQVIKMFADSKGRIWMAPFNKSVCYYYKGKIYNQDNDPILKSIKLSGHLISIAEDSLGNIALLQNTRLHVIWADKSVTVFMPPAGFTPNFLAIGTIGLGSLHLAERNRLLKIQGKEMVLSKKISVPHPSYRYMEMNHNIMLWRSTWVNSSVFRSHPFTQASFPFELPQMNYSIINDSLVSANEQLGARVYNINNNTEQRFLPGEAISSVAMDFEGNLWFSSMGHGVFMLNSQYIRHVSLLTNTGIVNGTYALAKYRDGWLVGGDMTNLYWINRDTTQFMYNFRSSLPERVTSVVHDGSGGVWVGTDARIAHLRDGRTTLDTFDNLTVKALFLDGDVLLAATGRNAVKIDISRKKPHDTIWNERTTTIFKQHDTIYIGTLDGLFLYLEDGTTKDLGQQYPQLGNRIMEIKQDPDGATLWIATYSGIYSLRHGRLMSSFTEKQGLLSNICRTLDIYRHELWIGTNKGLQKANISNKLQPVPEYSLSTELASDIINAVLADSNTVTVATPAGVSIVDKHRISFSARSELLIDNILVSGKKIPWEGGSFKLANKDNNIRFEFAGISFRSAGAMRYQYRLLGLDTNWKQTRASYLAYPTLPGGSYELQVEAVNKFGHVSSRISVPFSIEKKLWQKAWFQVLAGISAIALMWLALAWRIRTIRRQEFEKSSVQKKIAALEQLALKSQMNPHFIFNSLNSIQHYVVDKDIAGANKFITGFSRLIRQTLDISTRHEISLAEEIKYLSTYLQLERMRMEDRFTFEVVASPDLQPEENFVPPMILQPFVENCVRHGIRYRPDNQGRVLISFRKINGMLECAIEDNGVGRKTALLHKSRNPIEYQSKGISLTMDRLEMMNRSLSRPITIEILDLQNEQGEGAGTRVIVRLPVPLNLDQL
jgi:ligand-binding sensor domain-containing protein